MARWQRRYVGKPRPPVPRAATTAAPLSLEEDPKNSVTSPEREFVVSHCAHPRGWVRVVCKVHDADCWVPRRCHHCDSCRRLMAAEVRARAKIGLERFAAARPGAWCALLTLTSQPGTTWPEMVDAWSVFLRWLQRRRGGLLWLRVGETGSDTGMRHWHVVLLGWTPVPQAEISEAWKRATGGAYIVDIRARQVGEGSRALAYVLKGVGYVTKALAERDDDKSGLVRPSQFSHGWPSPAEARGERNCTWRKVDDLAGEVGPLDQLVGVSRSGVLMVRVGRAGCVASRSLTFSDHLHLWH